MDLQPVDTCEYISPATFREKYFKPGVPLVIRSLSKGWPAYDKWNWEYLKLIAGERRVGIYNNVKSDAYTPVNTADRYTSFGEYIDMVSKGPAEWRIFLFNLFHHAPFLTHDFTWPDQFADGFLKRVPMLFVGGQGSITHLHFDMDLSHIFHTQFIGKKRVLLFPFHEQYRLYRKPFEVLSLADLSYYYDPNRTHVDVGRFPALGCAKGYDLVLGHGDTLFMPAGYWHHMEYLESGCAMSLRAAQSSWTGKLKGLWNLAGMRSIDTLLKKTFPAPWYKWKTKRAYFHAALTEGQPQPGSIKDALHESGWYSPREPLL